MKQYSCSFSHFDILIFGSLFLVKKLLQFGYGQNFLFGSFIISNFNDNNLYFSNNFSFFDIIFIIKSFDNF